MLFPDGDAKDLVWGLIFLVVAVIATAAVVYGLWHLVSWVMS